MEREQFTFYKSFYLAMRRITDKAVRADIYDCLCQYAIFQQVPDLDSMAPEATLMFEMAKPVLDVARVKSIGGKSGTSKEQESNKTRTRVTQDPSKEKEKEVEKEEEIEKENEKENEIEDECMAGAFGEFWDLYPVKLGKEKAFEVWKRLSPDPQAVCEGVKNWLQTRQWEEQSGRFIPRAAKFLEERHYEQLPPGHIPKGASGVLGKAELEAIAKIMGNE